MALSSITQIIPKEIPLTMEITTMEITTMEITAMEITTMVMITTTTQQSLVLKSRESS
jgi:hypothetical protein